MKKVIGFLVAMVLATPAMAEFTAQEKVSLGHLREAINRTLRVVQYNCGNYGNETDCQYMMNAAYEEWQCTGGLFNVNVNPNDAGGEALLAGPRANVIAAAWGDCDRALYELGRASSFTSNYEYQQVLSQLAQVDQSLGYLDPYPDSALGFPNQFGPHGDYPKAQKALWKVMQYAHPAINYGWLDGMRAGALPASTSLISTYARLLNETKDVWYLSAHVIDPVGFDLFLTPIEETLPDEAKRALLELHLVNGPTDVPAAQPVSYLFRFILEPMANELKTYALSSASGPYIYEFLRRTADSWQHLDAWSGQFTKIE